MIRRPFVLAASGVLLAASLAACSTGPTDSGQSAAGTSSGSATGSGELPGADPDAFPVTIDHTYGETTIDAEPERVVTIGWTDTDVALSLGVVPAGAQEITWGGNGEGSTTWFEERLQEVGGEEPVRFNADTELPVTDIAEIAPDLILATNSGLTQEQYDKLSDIAPVVAYPGDPWLTPWQDSVEMVGEALGRSEAADIVVDETEQRIEQAKQDHPQLEGTSFLVTGLYRSQGYAQIPVYGPGDSRPQMLKQLGMVDAPVVDEVVPEGEFYANVSAERAADLESDFVFNFGDAPETFQEITDDELVGQIPAIESGHWVNLTDQPLGLTFSAPTPLSLPYFLDEVVPDIATAIDGEPVNH